VTELAEAQQRTEQRVAELAEAQRRTEERVTELAEAQQRTEQRVAELAEAQRRTEERLGILEQRVAELAEAQQRTDESLARLSQVVEIGFRELHQAIGNLVNRFGFDLEEFVAALLPPYLEKHLGISRLELERRYFDLGNGQVEEVDLAGIGQRAGRPVMVLVECRTTIRGSEAQKVVNKLQAIRATLKEEVEMVIVAMNIHPTAKAVGEAGGVRMVPYSRINRPGDFAE
jgi:DNA repair exonuclease SbcCD ATPase subunit